MLKWLEASKYVMAEKLALLFNNNLVIGSVYER
jgi:hypothetical protein